MMLLGEFLTLVQWLAVVCVVAASIGATPEQADAGRADRDLKPIAI